MKPFSIALADIDKTQLPHADQNKTGEELELWLDPIKEYLSFSRHKTVMMTNDLKVEAASSRFQEFGYICKDEDIVNLSGNLPLIILSEVLSSWNELLAISGGVLLLKKSGRMPLLPLLEHQQYA